MQEGLWRVQAHANNILSQIKQRFSDESRL